MNLLDDIKVDGMGYHKYIEKITKDAGSSLHALNNEDYVWNPPQSLYNKVDQNGSLRPYYGDTCVLPLCRQDILTLENFQDELYKKIDFALADRINADTFHITIHSLISNISEKEVINKLKENKNKCKDLFEKLAKYLEENPNNATIELTSTKLIPSCNISIFIGFIPATEKDFRILMNIYEIFEEVVPLKTILRLHSTIAYFKPVKFNYTQVKTISDALTKINDGCRIRIRSRIELKEFAYQNFTDMSKYNNIFSLKDFLPNDN